MKKTIRFRKTVILLAALAMLAGCGSADSGSSSPAKAEDAQSTLSQESTAESVPEKKEYAEGYYRIARDTAMYDEQGNAVPSGEERICRGKGQDGKLKISLPIANGQNELGEIQYVYKDYFIDNAAAVSEASLDEVRDTVVNYALAMSNKASETYTLSGEYVGENETRSDCSGLTELAYLRIGLYMEHYADAQANNYGKIVYDDLVPAGSDNGNAVYTRKDSFARVDYSQLEKGDLLFFLCATNSASDNDLFTSDGIGHVGMYVGDGKMVHFTASYGDTNDPCRVEDLKDYEDRQLKVERAVRYIY